jgi:hypothetical protein
VTDGGVPVKCFGCEKEFDSVEEMVAVPGRDGMSLRHFCEDCAERVRRGPPITDGGQPKPVDEMNVEEVEARLEDLRQRKKEAEDLRELIGDVQDDLRKIASHRLVDDELTAKLELLESMLGWVSHHDLQDEKAIHHEREQLRRRRIELETDRDLVTDGGTTPADDAGDEKPHPAVPPSEHSRARELDKGGSRTLDRERLDTPCPQCGGPVYYFEVATGEMMVATWDPEQFDPDQYELTEIYERREGYQECARCGWRVDL